MCSERIGVQLHHGSKISDSLVSSRCVRINPHNSQPVHLENTRLMKYMDLDETQICEALLNNNTSRFCLIKSFMQFENAQTFITSTGTGPIQKYHLT